MGEIPGKVCSNLPSSDNLSDTEQGRATAEDFVNSCTKFDESSIWSPKACSSPYAKSQPTSPDDAHKTGSLQSFGSIEAEMGSNQSDSITKISVPSLEANRSGFSYIDSPEAWAFYPPRSMSLASQDIQHSSRISEFAEESMIEYSVYNTPSLSEISDTSLADALGYSLEEGELLDSPTKDSGMVDFPSKLNKRLDADELDMDLSEISSGSL